MSTTSRKRRASPEKSRPSVWWLLAAIIVPIVGLIARIEIEGEENLPEEGSYVVAPNHMSEIDPLIVAVAVWRIGRAPRFLAKESLFRVPVLGWALRVTGMVPVARESTAAAASSTVASARRLVASGHGVIVYPEGTLTRDPDLWPMRGKTGAARLALAGDIPLIPVAHWGSQRILPRYGKLSLWPPRKRVRIVFGPALDLSAHIGHGKEQSTLVALTAAVMQGITSLEETLRGEKAPAERWNPSAHGQKETGRLDS